MKKFTALLLALLLVLSMTITAFATEENTTATGTITVNGAENDQTYSLYKIFDITTVNGANAYSVPSGRDYTATENFTTLFETNTATVGEGETATTVTYVTRKSGAQDSAIIAWAKANIAFFGTATTATAGNGKVEFTNVEQGYYYVNSPVSNGATAMIADTTQTATVVEKNSTPGWGTDPEDPDKTGGKEADGETYYAGDTITYTLTYYSAVNYDQGEPVTEYIIEDTLPEGITYKGDVSAKVNDDTVVLTTEETVDNGFKVSIPWTNEDGTSKYTTNPSKIVVTYTATMGNNKIAEGITNTAKIYPDTNKNPGSETEKEDTVYTGKIVLTKVDNSDSTKVLSGAKFKVKVGTGEEVKYLKETDGKYTEVTEADATEFVTDANGKITLAGLKAGTYTFVETEAPAGYNLPENPEFEAVVLELTADENGAVVVTSMSKTQQVNNSKAAAMPETGGMGTTMFYLVGSFLAVSAVILLITKKRMQADC